MVDYGVLLKADEGLLAFADKEVLQDLVVRPAVEDPAAPVPDMTLYPAHRFLLLVVSVKSLHLETVRPAHQGRYFILPVDGIYVQDIIAQTDLSGVAVLRELHPFHLFCMFLPMSVPSITMKSSFATPAATDTRWPSSTLSAQYSFKYWAESRLATSLSRGGP